jgi:hypothetical protein
MSHRLAPGLAAVLLSASIIAVAAPARAHPQAERHATFDAGAMLGGDPIREAQADLPRERSRAAWIRADAPESTLPGAVAAFAVLLVALVSARRPRWAISVIAVLALVVLSFEAGLHSVHHLGDDRGASQCSVASTSSHLAGTTAEPPSVNVSALPNAERLLVSECSALSRHPFRPDAGRAPPPASPAA